VDYDNTPNGIVVRQAQLTDIEGGAHVPPDEVLFGNPVGNYMWRSPESNIGGPIQTPTDIFSFGIVVSYPIPLFNFAMQLSSMQRPRELQLTG
jgi:serine/threonine protein kinase